MRGPTLAVPTRAGRTRVPSSHRDGAWGAEWAPSGWPLGDRRRDGGTGRVRRSGLLAPRSVGAGAQPRGQLEVRRWHASLAVSGGPHSSGLCHTSVPHRAGGRAGQQHAAGTGPGAPRGPAASSLPEAGSRKPQTCGRGAGLRGEQAARPGGHPRSPGAVRGGGSLLSTAPSHPPFPPGPAPAHGVGPAPTS